MKVIGVRFNKMIILGTVDITDKACQCKTSTTGLNMPPSPRGNL